MFDIIFGLLHFVENDLLLYVLVFNIVGWTIWLLFGDWLGWDDHD